MSKEQSKGESQKSQARVSYPRTLDVWAYLDSMRKVGGVCSFDLAHELRKVGACGRTYTQLDEWHSGVEMFVQVNCHKWFCPTCGGIDGREVQKRFGRAVEVFNSTLEIVEGRKDVDLFRDYFFRQFVFTVPESLRAGFQSAAGCSKLMSAVKRLLQKKEWRFPHEEDPEDRIIKNPFSGRQFMETFHAVGEEGGYTFEPHVNVLMPAVRSEDLKIPARILGAIKKAWLQVLAGYGYREKVVNVHYRYKYKVGQMVHALRYMQKPLGAEDGAVIMAEMLRDGEWELIEFYTIGLKNFHQVRHINKGEERVIEMSQSKEEERAMGEVEVLLRERGLLRPGQKAYFQYKGVVTAQELFMRYHPLTGLEKVGDGIYVQIPKLRKRK